MDNKFTSAQQPFFITESEYYKMHTIQNYGIDYIYQIYTSNLKHFVIPDGRADMIFCCSKDKPLSELCGTVTSPAEAIDNKHCLYFGICFLQDFNYIFKKYFDAGELSDNHLPAELILKRDTIQRIFETQDFNKQSELFLNEYLPVYESNKTLDTMQNIVSFVSKKIQQNKGNISIEAITSETGYSERYINKLFSSHMGIAPKTMGKIVRFQSVICSINKNSSIKLTDVAAESGYYDQSHFIKEFKTFSGMTPKKYTRHICEKQIIQKLIIT